tara:strand:+ start:12887 stop:13153 length:267 start_codon:yes stop_codon:yes gene_type:complete
LRFVLFLLKSFFLFLALAIGAIFAVYNDESISVNFVFVQAAHASLGVWLLLFMFVGVLVGILSSSLMVFRYYRMLLRGKKSSGTNSED